ncbi:MAG: ABC transporter permease [Magnetococcales bacterium]|nr:ABC transporter permease [Magnetococcales bacterium]
MHADASRAVQPLRFFWKILFGIARLTWMESARNRLPGALLLLIGLGWGLAAFLEEAAVTETVQTQSAILAALFRLAAVFLVSVATIAGSAREFQDRLVELLLALPIPRSAHFLGKLLGYALAACGVALLFGAALLPFAPVQQVVLWTLSLASELLLMVALGLVLILTLPQVPLALTVAMGFYLLARSIGALILMAAGPLPGHLSTAGQWEVALLTALSWLLPGLEQFTPTAWLVYHTGHWQDLLPILRETAIYLFFIVSIGLFDLYRKNF